MPIKHWLSPYMTEEASSKAPPPAAAFRLNLNNEEEEEEEEEEGGAKEPLFEKPLTPSDVGKLNRLVIPKQHAEKYFPLNGGGGGGGEKGLLLGFEDETGKSWRFRYSYWNSSQSYVLTKGWSRFVKEKSLDAGDVVLFARHPADLARLFIGWRRRNNAAAPPPPQAGWSALLYAHPYPNHSSNSSSVFYQTDCPHPHAENNHVKGRNGNSKRLRLFGVNLEWDEGETEVESGSGKGQGEEEPCQEYYSIASVGTATQ